MVLTIRQLRTFFHSPKQLKAACGSGGTAKDGEYEAQGDHVAAVMAARVLLGYAAVD
jgi:translation initiation factor 1 (eIF-1/SUI1)